MSQGLIYLASKARDVQDGSILAEISSSRLTVQYKHENPESERPYLTLQTQEESEPIVSSWPKTSSDLLNNNEAPGPLDLRPYEKLQTFEGAHEVSKGQRLPTIVCVCMEPGASPEEERDFEEWYRKQHLDMMSMCKGYRRCTRYRRLDGISPRYLAIHEYDCSPDELPRDQIAITTRTEWAQKILSEARVFDRNVFTFDKVLNGDGEQL